MKKVKETPKVINVLKEDKQAFGLRVGKITSLEKAYSYSLTSVPFAFASADGDSRQGSKAALRNNLIDESNCVTATLFQNAKWIIDGMATMRGMQPKKHGVNSVKAS